MSDHSQIELPAEIPSWLRDLPHLQWSEDGDVWADFEWFTDPWVSLHLNSDHLYVILLTYSDEKKSESGWIVKTSDFRVLRAAIAWTYDRLRDGTLAEHDVSRTTLFSPEGKSNVRGTLDLDLEVTDLVHPIESVPWARSILLGLADERIAARQAKGRFETALAQTQAERRRLVARLGDDEDEVLAQDDELLRVVEEAIEAVSDTSSAEALNKLWRIRQRVVEKTAADAREALAQFMRDDLDTWESAYVSVAFYAVEYALGDQREAGSEGALYDLLTHILGHEVGDSKAVLAEDLRRLLTKVKAWMDAIEKGHETKGTRDQ